jgi:hypothetical protein
LLLLLYPTKEQGVAWDLREMGSTRERGVREGPAPQIGSDISSQLPSRKEATATRSMRKKERRVRRDEEDPVCPE